MNKSIIIEKQFKTPADLISALYEAGIPSDTVVNVIDVSFPCDRLEIITDKETGEIRAIFSS